MKKALFTFLLGSLAITQAFAQFNYVGQNGSNLQVNGNQVQVGGMINGNQVQVGNNGFSINGPGGSLSVGNTSGLYGSNAGGLMGLIQMASKITGMLVPILVSLAVLAFFWYLVQFIWKGKDDPKIHSDGIKGMGYSILAIFVMISIWGIIGFIGATTGINQGGGMPALSLPGMK